MPPSAASTSPSGTTGYGAKRKRVSDRCNKLGRKAYGETRTRSERLKKNGASPSPTALPEGIGLDQILHLLDVYYITVYPIYAYFSWPHFVADVKAKRYECDPAFRATVLTVCAISAARIRDGAYQLVSSRSPEAECPIDHKVLREAAKAAVPSGPLNRPLEFDDLRAASLMHVLGIQDGDFELVQVMLGRYHGISAYFRFHNERFWPADLEDWQREERRTLFWSTYTSDVFLSSVWDGMILHHSSQSHVQYPSHRLDEQHSSPENHWVIGWNTVTDLYRILERIMEADALNKAGHIPGPPPLPLEFHDPVLPIDTAWPAVRMLFDALPPELKECAPLTGDVTRDIYSFTAANLNVTLQAVRMAIACSNPISMAERCNIAGELLDTLARIPTAYMQGISAPFVHQLGAVGSLLGEVVQGPLTVSAYIHVRQILLTFGNILSHLESSLKCTGTGISERLFDHVARIDAFMQTEATGIGQDMLRDAIDAQRLTAMPKLDVSAPVVAQPLPLPAPFDPSAPLPAEVHAGASAPPLPDSQEMFTIPDDLLQDWLFPQDQQLFDSLFRGQ